MNTLTLHRRFEPFASLGARHRTWVVTAAGMTALCIACALLASIDPRLFNGVSVWTKPAKFAASLAIYFATLAWFAPLLGNGYFERRRGRVLTWLPVGFALFEIGYITWQAGLGEASHFNFSSAFHGAMFGLMGLGAVILVLACLWFGAAVLRNPANRADPYRLAVGLGLILTCLLGGATGQAIVNNGSHWIGGASTDAGGLMIVNWVRDGGDLRVAHFFGMHAMQALPLAALPLAGRDHGLARATVVALACAWAAFTIVTLIQAVRGLPFAG
jgi:hypothetical protein